ALSREERERIADVAVGSAVPRDRLEGAGALVAAVARDRPVVLHLRVDDAEDQALARHLGSAGGPVLILAETTDPGPAAVALGPMSDTELGALADALLPLRPSLRARLVALAGGHPAFLSEILADRIESDAFVMTDGLYDLRPDEALVLPPAIREHWRQRIE